MHSFIRTLSLRIMMLKFWKIKNDLSYAEFQVLYIKSGEFNPHRDYKRNTPCSSCHNFPFQYISGSVLVKDFCPPPKFVRFLWFIFCMILLGWWEDIEIFSFWLENFIKKNVRSFLPKGWFKKKNIGIFH